jgi:hypothetical protein
VAYADPKKFKSSCDMKFDASATIPTGTGEAISGGANQRTDQLAQFFERIPPVVSIAACPIRLMDESLAALNAEHVQKGSH